MRVKQTELTKKTEDFFQFQSQGISYCDLCKDNLRRAEQVETPFLAETSSLLMSITIYKGFCNETLSRVSPLKGLSDSAEYVLMTGVFESSLPSMVVGIQHKLSKCILKYRSRIFCIIREWVSSFT